MTEVEAAPPEAIMPLVTGHFVSQIVRTHVAFGLPDMLRNAPHTAEQVAASAGCDPLATFRLLRAGVAVGLVTYDPETTAFAETPVLAALRSDAPGSLANLSLVWTHESHWLPWGRLTDAVRSGRNLVPETLEASTLWDFFSRDPEGADLFGRAVSEISRPVIAEAVKVIDPGPAGTIVDIGGANGEFVLSLLDRHPEHTGIIFDLPTALSGARAEIEATGMGERCTAVGGDFFVEVPEADLYLLKYILHDWDDQRCIDILRRCRSAMRPGARILVVDAVIGGPEDPSTDAALMDMNMLAVCPGREHDLPDFDRFFAAADLRRAEVTSVLSPYQIIEAVAAEPS